MIALLFPGQGSQHVGMGKALAERFPIAKLRFEEADTFFSYTGVSLIRLMYEGPEALLNETQWAQPALFALSAALFDVLSEHCKDKGWKWVAGHSLGEYSALYAAGSISFQGGLSLIQSRCRAMANVKGGAMAAILKLDICQVQELLDRHAQHEIEIANDNCPGQIVVSGHKAGLQEVLAEATAIGARCIPLKVSGPFHTSHMKPAAEVFSRYLAPIMLSCPELPVITNVSAEPQTNPELIKKHLEKQITGRVRWRESLNTLYTLGATHYLEIGPGSVLTGLVRKTLDSVYSESLGEFSNLESWIAYNTQPTPSLMSIS